MKIRRYFTSARLVGLSCPAGEGKLARGAEFQIISSQDAPEKEDTARNRNLETVAAGEGRPFDLGGSLAFRGNLAVRFGRFGAIRAASSGCAHDYDALGRGFVSLRQECVNRHSSFLTQPATLHARPRPPEQGAGFPRHANAASGKHAPPQEGAARHPRD